MLFGMSFEEIFTYVTLGVTGAHKLVDVAKWFAAQTKTQADDAAVGAVEKVLTKVSAVLGYLPALRLKVGK